MRHLISPLLAAVLCGMSLCGAAQASERPALVVASRADVLSMDPYALDESLQLDTAANVYEPLVTRDARHQLVGALATRWQATGPRTWRFYLRRGVRFHDGSAFSAADVLFSFQRARSAGSDIGNIVAPIKTIRAAGPYVVEIELHEPSPVFPDTLPYWLIMSKAWSLSHGAASVKPDGAPAESYAARHANGTGPFRLVSRNPGVATQYAYNPHYWGKVAGNVGAVTFRPIPDDAARTEALLRGAADIVNPLPLTAHEQVRAQAGVAVRQAPELRVILLGMDQSSPVLAHSDVRDRNPLADVRVRQALELGLDVKRLVAEAMQGAATPLALLIPRQVQGYSAELDSRRHDPEQARALLKAAGYADGFGIDLNCPNNRYINDAAVCEAVARQLLAIGVRVTVVAEDKAVFFDKIFKRQASFYLLGVTTGTGDGHSVLYPVMASPDDFGGGKLNLGGYLNPQVDALLRAANGETQLARRTALMVEAQRLHQQEVGHIPLYQQWQSWGAREGIQLVQTPEGGMPWREIVVSPATKSQQ